MHLPDEFGDVLFTLKKVYLPLLVDRTLHSSVQLHPFRAVAQMVFQVAAMLNTIHADGLVASWTASSQLLQG
jgi:hypothetical protein